MYLQTSKTFVQVETNNVLQELGVEDRHLVAGFKTMWLQGGDLKEEPHKISSEIVKFLQKLLKFFPGVSNTPMHLWDKNLQKFQSNKNQNKGSLSENVMKEDERVLIHPPD